MRKEVDSLTIKMEGAEQDNVPLDSFSAVVQNASKALRALDPNRTLVWRVTEAKKNSPLLLTTTADALKNDWNPRIVDTFFAIVRAVDGSGRMPPNCPPKAIAGARAIVAVLTDGVGNLEITSPGRDPIVARPVQRACAPSEQKKQRWEYEDYSELDGYLEIASTHGGFKHVYIYDELSGRPTECRVSSNIFVEALELLKHEDSPRVSVYGRVRYNSDGYPVEVIVETLERLPGLADSTDPRLVQGINITDGVDSVAYVRGLRDDE